MVYIHLNIYNKKTNHHFERIKHHDAIWKYNLVHMKAIYT